MSELKKHDVLGAAAKWYTKKVCQTPRDMGIEKASKYLKNNALLAVPFDKGVGFCVRKKNIYEGKLTQLLEAEQFERHDKMNHSVVQKI